MAKSSPGRVVDVSELEEQEIGIWDPRNKTYMTSKARVIRAWGLPDGRTELVDVASGHNVVMSDAQVQASISEGELEEIHIPTGGSMRWTGSQTGEDLPIPNVLASLAGKYGGKTKSKKEPLPMLEIVDLSNEPDLHSPVANLAGKYANSAVITAKPQAAPRPASTLVGKYATRARVTTGDTP